MAFKDDNEKERMRFVDFWSKYVMEHDDSIWSRQQNMIINSALRSSSMTKKQFMAMKKEDVWKNKRNKRGEPCQSGKKH